MMIMTPSVIINHHYNCMITDYCSTGLLPAPRGRGIIDRATWQTENIGKVNFITMRLLICKTVFLKILCFHVYLFSY